MPPMETITIINKSGKVVSTGKHLVNIFKEAREAYNEKKSSLKTEHRQKIEFKQAQKLLEARNADDGASIASSHRSRRSHRHRDEHGVSRPPLTERHLSHLSHISEGSVTSSRRSRSQHGSRRGSRDVRETRYRSPYMEEAAPSQPHLVRRHTEFPGGMSSELSRTPSTLPPPYARSASNPDFHPRRHSEEDIDMNLAYGTPPLDLMLAREERTSPQEAAELKATMSKLDTLLLEAHCVQHSATAIIKNLQDNPEAMAAVALTLAELSNILTKMSPAILTGLKSSSPAVFALLASPQFLIAGGLALGVTVVMFGGYKIVKKIQADNMARKEANRMEEALVWNPESEVGSIETWRRGIVAADGDGTSVEGEFITPEAQRQNRERIRERRREERSSGWRVDERVSRRGSVAGSVRSERTLRRSGSDETLRRRDLPIRASTVAVSESGRSRKDKGKGKESVVSVKEKEKRDKKDKKEKDKASKVSSPSAISVFLNKRKGKGGDDKSEISTRSSHRPRIVEL